MNLFVGTESMVTKMKPPKQALPALGFFEHGHCRDDSFMASGIYFLKACLFIGRQQEYYTVGVAVLILVFK